MSQTATEKIAQTYAKQRLLSLFSEIEKEFDLILEENYELKKKIAILEKTSDKEGRNIPQISITPTPIPISNTPESPRFGRKIHSSKEKKDAKKSLTDAQVTGQPLYPQKSDSWVHTQELTGHRDGVWEVSPCPWSLKRIGSASADRTARVWTLTPNYPHILYVGHTGSVNTIRFHPKDRFVCTASGDRTCHIWKIPSISKKEKENYGRLQKNIAKNTKLWSPLLDSSSQFDQNIEVIDNSPPTGKTSFVLSQNDQRNEKNANLALNENAFISSVSPSFEPNFEVYDVSDITLTTPLTILSGHNGPIIAADWISNGSSIASVSWDNSIALWDTEGGTKISYTDSVHEEGHTFTNINKNGDISSPLAITSSTDGVVRVWDIRSSKQAINSIAHESAVNSACFSQTEEMVIFSGGDDRACRSWDLRNTKQPINVIRCSSAVNRFSISPISSTIAIPLDDRRTKICDVTGNRLGNLRSHDKGGHTSMVTATAWSNDESVLYTSSFTRHRSIIAWTKDHPKRKKAPEASH